MTYVERAEYELEQLDFWFKINKGLQVRKYLNGKGMRYVPENHNLIIIYSMTDKGYRAIKKHNIESIKYNGIIYSSLI